MCWLDEKRFITFSNSSFNHWLLHNHPSTPKAGAKPLRSYMGGRYLIALKRERNTEYG